MFQVDDKVFYPYHGAGEIKKIEEKKMMGSTRTYFIVRFPLTETTVMIPIDKTKELGLRYLSTQIEIKKCMEMIASSTSDPEEDWKLRYKKHQEMLKSGTLNEVSEVLKNLYDRNRIKELSTTEKKIYNSALDMIISEIALSMNKKSDEVKEEIQKLLENRK